MPLPLTTRNAKDVFDELKLQGAWVQEYAQQVSSSASFSAKVLEALLTSVSTLLTNANAVKVDTALSANLVAYIQQISGSTTVQADFDASLAALAPLQTAIIAEYPKDSAGHPLDRSIDANGNITPIAITAAQIPNTLAAITTWLATVQ